MGRVGGSILEALSFSMAAQNTGDLEAATKTITATSKQAVADYSAALTIAQPSDARIAIRCIGTRLSVVIDSITAGTLYGRVYVDNPAGDDAAKLLLDLSWTTTGTKLDGVNTNALIDGWAASKAAIFTLLNDGTAHTFYFFFWVDAGNAVLSLVQLWEGVGWYGITGRLGLTVTHRGLATLGAALTGTAIGSGAANSAFTRKPETYSNISSDYDSSSSNIPYLGTLLMAGRHHFRVSSSVATDLTYFGNFFILLRTG